MVQGSVGRSVCMVQGRTRRSVCESKTQQNSNSMSSRQRDGLFVSKGGLRVSRWRRRCCFVVLSLTCNGHDVQEEGCIVATACLLACLPCALARTLSAVAAHSFPVLWPWLSVAVCLHLCLCWHVYVGRPTGNQAGSFGSRPEAARCLSSPSQCVFGSVSSAFRPVCPVSCMSGCYTQRIARRRRETEGGAAQLPWRGSGSGNILLIVVAHTSSAAHLAAPPVPPVRLGWLGRPVTCRVGWQAQMRTFCSSMSQVWLKQSRTSRKTVCSTAQGAETTTQAWSARGLRESASTQVLRGQGQALPTESKSNALLRCFPCRCPP